MTNAITASIKSSVCHSHSSAWDGHNQSQNIWQVKKAKRAPPHRYLPISLSLSFFSSTSMASVTHSFSPIHYPTRVRTHKSRLSPSSLPLPFQSHPFPPLPLGSITVPAKTRGSISFAYVSGPASDPSVTESGPRVDPQDFRPEKVRPAKAISWGLLWSLLGAHKLRLAISALTLLGCTTCTLSMPIFTGTATTIYHFHSYFNTRLEERKIGETK